MAGETDIRKDIKETETWHAWRNKYHLLRFNGKDPNKSVEAHWEAIPPDTYSSMMYDFASGADTKPFSAIEEELTPKQIRAVLEHYSAFTSIAVMDFFRRRD